MTKRVWLLGAGFSAGLGGPLLPDLLSMRSWQRMRAHWDDLDPPYNHPFHAIYHLYHYGTGYPEGYCLKTSGLRGEKSFRDAEDFLVRLDDEGEFIRGLCDRVKAANRDYDTNILEAFNELLKTNALTDETAVKAWTSKLIARECQFFLEDKDESTWGPYRRWAERLNDEDTIITFNYDRVIEELRPTLKIYGVGDHGDRKIPTLLKMHGSIDWYQDGDKIVARSWSKDTSEPPLLGLPGRSKTAATRSVFKEIWEMAERTIQGAEEIYIIGYGLPESDADSRRTLLAGIKANQAPHLAINLVLGEKNFRVRRLAQTIEQVFRRAPVFVREQFAQDFLEGYAQGRM